MNETKIYYIRVYEIRLKTVVYICPTKFLFDTKIFFTVFFISEKKKQNLSIIQVPMYQHHPK